MHGAIDIVLAAILAVFIFAKANLSVKTAKFCTMQKFLTIQYVHVTHVYANACSPAYMYT